MTLLSKDTEKARNGNVPQKIPAGAKKTVANAFILSKEYLYQRTGSV